MLSLGASLHSHYTRQPLESDGGACQEEGESFCFIVRFSVWLTYPLTIVEQREDSRSRC
jgi:hypothetical protein